MPHAHEFDPAMLTADFWDERYGATERIWSGNPNPHLVTEAGDLPPGAALEVGAGEGADAIWLAEHGWSVLAIDLSQVALDRAAGIAEQHGADVAGRITWQAVDLLNWTPPAASFDLVNAQFFHLPPDLLTQAYLRLGTTVRPGGSFLIVLHHFDDLETTAARPHSLSMFPTPDEVIARFPTDDWELVTKASPTRDGRDPDGRPIVLRDSVVRLRRR